MTDNKDDLSTMGDNDNNDQHDEHYDNDDESQAIATYTQAQLATLVAQAINQSRNEFQNYIKQMEAFHKEEVEAMRMDFERLAKPATPTNTPPKTRFFAPHTKRQQDVDYARLTAGANKERTEPPTQGQPSPHESAQAPAPAALRANPALPNTNDPQMAAFVGVMAAQQATLTTLVGKMGTTSSSKDISEPPKYTGHDDNWEGWYKLLRSYFKQKGWLTTFEHPDGPGTPELPTADFDFAINTKIHSKLQHLCYGGTAATYIAKAAEFDGHGAGVHLRGRYDGFTKQKLKQYVKLIGDLKHTNGTNMATHVDTFEATISRMPFCGKTPTETEKITWFMDSVSETTHAAVKAQCDADDLRGTLQYETVVSLYNNQCFSKYPHFQLQTVLGKTLSNNGTFAKGGAKDMSKCCEHHNKYGHTTEECNAMQHHNEHGTGQGQGNDYGEYGGDEQNDDADWGENWENEPVENEHEDATDEWWAGHEEHVDETTGETCWHNPQTENTYYGSDNPGDEQ